MSIPRLALTALLGLAFAIAAAPAFAEDEPPPYGAADLAIEDDGLAEGWEIVYDELPGTPGEGIEVWIVSVGKACGIDEDALYTEYRILKGPEGVVATLAVVEIEGDLGSFPETLASRGKAQGYTVRPIGHPSRILVLASPESVRQAILDMEKQYAVRILSELGFERLERAFAPGALHLRDARAELAALPLHLGPGALQLAHPRLRDEALFGERPHHRDLLVDQLQLFARGHLIDMAQCCRETPKTIW